MEQRTPATANRFAVQQARLRVIELARQLEKAFDEDYGWDEHCDAEIECEHHGKCPQCGAGFRIEGKQKCGNVIEVEFTLDEQRVPLLRELRLALAALEAMER
jgi:hypothetical protein